ncbi:zinc finger protein 239-like isoform X3 [Scomber scombrus]|uniref:Zinc finger protein 239-like isoform X3 n=2 Tax=Scomber scombrus TaxID=13677 RepID=A0AAV1QGH1_SCOSC
MKESQNPETNHNSVQMEQSHSPSATTDKQGVNSGPRANNIARGSNALQRWLKPDIKHEEEEEQSVSQRGDLLDFTDQDHYENGNHNSEHHAEQSDSPSATTDKQKQTGLHCEKALTTSQRLKRADTREKHHSCDQCGKAFTTGSNLQVHQRIHTGEKPYSCDQCGKAFTKKSSLKVHERIHTGEKLYNCEQCGKAFTTNGALKIHYRIHTGEKPYSCDQCGKAFTTNAEVKLHRHIHTGEKLYSCDQCGKAFITKCSLQTHQHSHTASRDKMA